VPTASDERKTTMERQFAELDIPYPVHYLEAKILDKEAVGYVPETMSLIDKRTVLSTRSHIRAIELAGRDSSPEFSLIMEDDVAIHKEDFKRVLNEIVKNYEKYVSGHLERRTFRPTGISNGQFCEAKPSETADIVYDTLAKDCRNEMTGGLM